MKTITAVAAQKMIKAGSIDEKLFNEGYTIVMPKKQANNWLKALRSGEYIQTASALHNSETGGFCCLGVEQYCNNDGYVENTFNAKGKGDWNGFPTLKYLKSSGYLFVGSNNHSSYDPFIQTEGKYGRPVSSLNDDTKFVTKKVNQHAKKSVKVHVNSFSKIADILEKAMLVY